MPAPPKRSPEEIRASIEANRKELGRAVESLQAEVKKATDWRSKLEAHKQQALIGAAATGFVLGGGIGGFFGLFKSGD